MAVDKWNGMAANMVLWVRANLVSAVREAVILTRDTEAIDMIVVFGGASAGAGEQLRQEIEQLRQSVHEAGYQEMAHAQCSHDSIWVMVVDSRNRSSQLSALLNGWLTRTSRSLNHVPTLSQPSKRE